VHRKNLGRDYRPIKGGPHNKVRHPEWTEFASPGPNRQCRNQIAEEKGSQKAACGSIIRTQPRITSPHLHHRCKRELLVAASGREPSIAGGVRDNDTSSCSRCQSVACLDLPPTRLSHSRLQRWEDDRGPCGGGVAF